VFTKTTAGWKHTAELKGSGEVSGDFFGSSVAISGSTVVVGLRVDTHSALLGGIRVHQDGSRVEASGRPRGLEPYRPRQLRYLGALSA